VPFCASRCDYCAFATWTDRHHLAGRYVDACLAEIDRTREGGLEPASTVFLGGGTPSQLAAADLSRLLEAALGVSAGGEVEVTVEANPEDVTPGWLEVCRAAGVNRISLGVQSFDRSVLESLGRRHSAEAVAPAAAAIAAAGIQNYSIDLIFGAAAETDRSWQATLAAALDLDPRPSHISAYALTVEAGTPLWRDPGRYPDDDTQARRYEMADEALVAAGYGWYEISNWSVAGSECRHNLNYWMQGDYRGIGCAAHSHRCGRRWWNVRTPERYIDLVTAGERPVAAGEELSPETQAREALELLVRTRWGVPARALEGALEAEPALTELVAISDGRAVLTPRGRMLANEVAARLTLVSNGPPARTECAETG
jgi:oxygen-independent coproporphyrinogen-3 oxidase